ncbi:LacI family DNA-binding transcriptional regulator [Kribbella sandramycini]|uniref:DNA-binding LacI/PurR family transcriptional regulator n=1 Tax=Kribbella sandramycini TaxID=60450 RepID=A0A7Y4NYH3_9ACTN|nr:DNA-binding LacI/PurR family transcriptional regulator [Kribbella sandramycini]NOL39843.1 LacI family DNA-binding transcriptional regulator [Kribbella sandramycini]
MKKSAVVTMADVARTAGVSTMTVSNVVNGRPRVGAATRERVLAAINELGYQVNLAARHLRAGRTGVVGLAVPELERPYFAQLAGRLADQFEAHGLRIVMERTGASREGELDAVAFSRLRMYDGLILSVVDMDPGELTGIGTDAPVVMIGERALPSRFDHVLMDNVDGARQATAQLLAGNRRIAMLGGDPAGAATMPALRAQGYALAHHAAGVPIDPALNVQCMFGFQDGYDAVRSLLDRGIAFDAVFALTDVVAIGALRALADAGIQVPAEVELIGFDDLDEAAYLVPSLSTINPGHEQMAAAITRLLLARLAGEPAAEAQELIVPAALVLRGTTRSNG